MLLVRKDPYRYTYRCRSRPKRYARKTARASSTAEYPVEPGPRRYGNSDNNADQSRTGGEDSRHLWDEEAGRERVAAPRQRWIASIGMYEVQYSTARPPKAKGFESRGSDVLNSVAVITADLCRSKVPCLYSSSTDGPAAALQHARQSGFPASRPYHSTF